MVHLHLAVDSTRSAHGGRSVRQDSAGRRTGVDPAPPWFGPTDLAAGPDLLDLAPPLSVLGLDEWMWNGLARGAWSSAGSAMAPPRPPVDSVHTAVSRPVPAKNCATLEHRRRPVGVKGRPDGRGLLSITTTFNFGLLRGDGLGRV